jgi:hypothetical protein
VSVLTAPNRRFNREGQTLISARLTVEPPLIFRVVDMISIC